MLRYTVDVPVERLLEFIPAEEFTGEALCDLIVKALTDASLDIVLSSTNNGRSW